MSRVLKGKVETEEVISKYVENYPEKAAWIRDIVLGYVALFGPMG